MPALLLLQRGRPGHELKLKPIIDHRIAAGGQHHALTVGARDILPRTRLAECPACLAGQPLSNLVNLPVPEFADQITRQHQFLCAVLGEPLLDQLLGAPLHRVTYFGAKTRLPQCDRITRHRLPVEPGGPARRHLILDRQVRTNSQRNTTLPLPVIEGTKLHDRPHTTIHAELSVSDLRREYAVRKAALAGAIGVPAEALDSIALDTKAFDVCPDLMEYRDSQDMRYQAVMQRADLRELLASYDAARQALRVEVSRRYPDVTISPAYNWDISNRFEVNPSLQIPIFNQNEGPIAEAVGQEHEAAARLRRAENTVFKSISQATANYRGTTSILLQADELAKTVRVRLNQMQHRLQSGAIDRPTMVMTHIEQIQAETALLEAEIQQRQAIGQIEDGMQQPIFDHTSAAQVSGLLENNQRNSP